nr:hypothetical protein [Tanacetum cinerariifolium]
MLHVLRVKMVINSPWMLSKNRLVQKQTAFGKDMSNPFMADNLPKIVWFSTHHITCMKSWLVQKQTALGQTATGKESSNSFMAGDVTRLQALVDKKRIVITEAVVREILQLNDAEGVICLSNEEIFASLARIGYEKPSTKLTFYKAFFSTQWKFFIHTILHSLSAKITLWNEFSLAMASVVLDTCSAFARWVEGLENDKAAQQLEIVKLKARVKKLEKINMVTSSKLRRLKKVGTSQRVESSDDMENDEGIELVANQEKDAEVEGRHADKQAKLYNLDLDHSSKVLSIQEDDTEVQEAVEIVTTAKLMTEVVIGAQVVAASTPIPAAKPKILNIAAAPADRIEMDIEYARKLQEEINKEHEETYKNINWNAALDHVQSKEPQYIKRYHEMKKKPQTESEALKNMIFFLKNTEGYKMDFFKGMKYDEILPIFQAKFDANMRFLFKSREEMAEEDKEIIKSINETPAQKATKRRKLHEQAKEDEDLKKQLEVVDDEDDDVFIEATPIVRKVSVVDYEIVMINNKPRYKIIKADGTHQLYINFITLLKNFNREDLEDLWRIVKARFSTSKPTNFSDDHFLSTLKTMFEMTDGQDAIWRNQQSVYGQALVKS